MDFLIGLTSFELIPDCIVDPKRLRATTLLTLPVELSLRALRGPIGEEDGRAKGRLMLVGFMEINIWREERGI